MENTRMKILLEYMRYLRSFDKPHKQREGLIEKLIKKLIISTKLFYSTPRATPCDILFLHTYRLGVSQTEKLWRSLELKGFKVCHEVISFKEILKRRMLWNNIENIPEEFIYEAGYAKYIIEKYRPKVLCSFMDNSLISPFLRYEMRKCGKCANIAHGVTGSSHNFSMFDFDYYFVFGKRSVENIMNNRIRIGNTKAVLTGSPFVSFDLVLPPNFGKKNILFFSTWLTPSVKDILIRNMKIVLEWAKLHPEYNLFVKLHPLENSSTIKSYSKGTDIKVLEKNVNMRDALKDVSLVLLSWSSAAVEAALLNRPIVVVNDSDMVDNYLYLEKFFLPRAKTVVDLQKRIDETFKDYKKYLSSCRKFVDYHLEHKLDSIPFIANCIESICIGQENFEFFSIEENLMGLGP